MSHELQMRFVEGVKRLSPGHFTGRRVLECGSLNVNGSVRKFFEGCEYTGADVFAGKDVDVVLSARAACRDLEGPWDVVISCEMLEHDAEWSDSIRAMDRAVAPGGLLLVTCAGEGRLPHGLKGHELGKMDPWATSHYRNISGQDFMARIDETQYAFWGLSYDKDACDLRFWGIKRLIDA